MRKSRIDTLFVFFVLFGIVVGGWFFTKELLYQKRTEFLETIGQISLEPSDSTAFMSDGRDHVWDGSDSTVFMGEELSEEQMAEVLEVWERGGIEVPHEPQTGQMSMEQAITAGKDWITAMADHGIISAGGEDKTIHARLCTIETEVDFDKKLLSYWSIEYIKEELTVKMVIHAVSGQIWNAQILMWEENGLTESYIDEKWIGIAFPFMKDWDVVYAVEGGEEEMEEGFAKGCVRAVVRISEVRDVKGDWEKSLLRLEFGLGTEKKMEMEKIYQFSDDN